MPIGNPSSTSSLKSRSKKREDVTDKIREIKQRQQNWLQQREQSKHVESKPRALTGKPTSSKPVSASKAVAQKSATAHGSNTQAHMAVPPQKQGVRDKFQHWIASRNRTLSSDEDADFNDSNSVRSGAESELERLVTPEPDTTRQPISEENFGDLANQIANRVKQDLGLSAFSPATDTSKFTEFSLEESTWAASRCQTYTQEAPVFIHQSNSGLTSHNCLVCKKLMLSSSHIPMMVIPCGHTLCKSCSEKTKLCPSCDCRIVSLTLNIMLQQVIQEYYSHPLPDGPRKGSSHSRASDSLDRMSSAATSYSPGKYVEENKKNHHTSYRTQLATLETRKEILSNEYRSLKEHHKTMSNKLQQEKTQAANIAKQEEEITKSISELQDRLEALKCHRQQYESQVTQLQEEQSELEGKVTLLTSTLSTLNREIEKVKLLAEDES